MPKNRMLSASMEDYLEAIFHIVSEKQAARAKDIAKRLKVNNSSVTGALRSLAEKGVQIIVCSTCLNHFELMDELQVGSAGGMKDMVAAQWSATKVITL